MIIKAPCQSEACKRGLAEYHEKRRRKPGPLAGRVRDVAAGPESYDDQEVKRLHLERLRASYAAYCARVPAGYRPVTPTAWLASVGDLATLVPDKHWLHANTPPSLAVEWREP